MKKTLAFAFAVLALALVPACSSDDGDGTDPAADENVVTVQVTNNVFNPASVKIKVGQTVRWTWAGGVHDVVSGTNCTDDGKFKSELMGGGTYDKKFDTAGTFPYYCTPHCTMGMVGEVIVE